MTTKEAGDPDLADSVRTILLTEWDPIGIQELPPAMRDANADEYDGYVGPLTQMIMEGRGENDLADYLRDVEGRKMGLKPQSSRALTAAKALAELKRTYAAAATH